ncbi:MAG: hypothetical protein JXA42_01915 [Anaerolineales bacterium]|nr:hypothetical protein [Anaerolineales bacterium]
MSDILEQITGDKSALAKLAEKIPGLGDFIERNDLRAADKLLRDTLAKRVEEQRRRVNDLQQQMLGGSGLLFLDDLERAQTKLGTFADSIRTASYGYAGLFDKVKKDEEELNTLYDYDNHLYENIQEISTALDNLQTTLDNDENIQAAVRELDKAARSAMEAFRRREEVFISE